MQDVNRAEGRSHAEARDLCHRIRGLTSLADKVRGIKGLMLALGLEVMRSQRNREHRHFGLQLDIHKSGDDSLRHEIMPVDATINNESCGNDRVILTGLGKFLRQERHFKCARHIKRHHMSIEPQLLDPLNETGMRLINDVSVPTSLDESDF